MPRTADHDERRAQIADAAFELIAHVGLDAATMAAVAREAGVSVGLVQHYFRSKDDLLAFTYRRTVSAVLDRAAALITAGEADRERIEAILLRCLQQLWPLDATRLGEYRVARAFYARALDDPGLAAVAEDAGAGLHRQIARAVENGKECGETDPGTDADLAALHLASLTAGLAENLHREPTAAPAAVAILRAALAGVFPGECRRYRPVADEAGPA